jgi:outer membrane protein
MRRAARCRRGTAPLNDQDATMRRTFPALALIAALAPLFAHSARGEDLMQIYRDAVMNDPLLASAQANWQATQEVLPQAKAGLLPNASATGAFTGNRYETKVKNDPNSISNNYGQINAGVSAAQPLFRYQNIVNYDQAKQTVAQSDDVLELARQDLILRVAQAYFDVLLAEFNIELAQSQKKAVEESLAQAKRNFEVGVATITDTNEAQAKYDQIVAQEIAARNDYDNKVTVLRAIIGRQPKELRRVGQGLVPVPPDPDNLQYWVDRSRTDNLNVKVAERNFDIATLQIDKAKAGHYPTLDLVASYGYANYSGAAINLGISNYSTTGTIGVQVAVPIYQGGFVDSTVRQAIALQDKSRQDLEFARRTAFTLAQTGYTGVVSSVASVKAFEQALVSAESAYQSNVLGQEVGVRTFLDVLNVQQNVYSTRRDLAQAYFNYLIGWLRLKSAIGTLTEVDLEAINRQLRG